MIRDLNASRLRRFALLLPLGAASARCSSTQATPSDASPDVAAGSLTDALLSDAAALTDAGPDVEVGPSVDASDGGTSPDASPAGDGAVSPVPPAPAAAAGFTHVVFEDDFTTNDTIAPTQNAASGYKWYWSFDDSTVHPWSVSTTATAASIANGNTGGGNNASPHGGILTVNGPGAPNDALVTVPGWALNNAGAVLPAEGNGCWSHAYFEAYIQFQIDGTDSSAPSTGWPA